jgi:hypothetical protein
LLPCNLIRSPIISAAVETISKAGAGASRRDVLGVAATECVHNRVAIAPVVVNSTWKL